MTSETRGLSSAEKGVLQMRQPERFVAKNLRFQKLRCVRTDGGEQFFVDKEDGSIFCDFC